VYSNNNIAINLAPKKNQISRLEGGPYWFFHFMVH